MTRLAIAQIGNPALRRRARPVDAEQLASDALQTLIDDLIETMRGANGAGLAAPQVERDLRICVVELEDNPRYPFLPALPLEVLINPVITPLEEARFAHYEGCLSVPGLRGEVQRHLAIGISFLDRRGQPRQKRIRGVLAGVFQHEVDHLDGTLFVDRVEDPASLTTLAEFERFHRAAYLERIAALPPSTCEG